MDIEMRSRYGEPMEGDQTKLPLSKGVWVHVYLDDVVIVYKKSSSSCHYQRRWVI